MPTILLKTPFDFKNTVITGNTRIYARWQVNAEYAASEINMPTKTVGQYQNGNFACSPTVLPGEKRNNKYYSSGWFFC